MSSQKNNNVDIFQFHGTGNKFILRDILSKAQVDMVYWLICSVVITSYSVYDYICEWDHVTQVRMIQESLIVVVECGMSFFQFCDWQKYLRK